MRRVLIGLGVVLLIVIALLLVLPFVVPANQYQGQVIKAVQDATGRDLTLNGDLRLSFLPRLELEANELTFANPPGAQHTYMATVKQAQLALQVMPLLSGEVRIESFTLVEPELHLEVDADGRGNWEFAGTDDAAAHDATPDGPDTGGGGSAPVTELSLGDIRITRGLVTYADARSGASYTVSDVDVTVSLPNLDSPFGAEGSVTWNGEPLKLHVTAENPRALMSGGASAVSVNVAAKPVQVVYTGNAAGFSPMRVAGDLTLDAPSLRGLTQWAGMTLDLPGEAFGPLHIAGKVDLLGCALSFRDAELRLDDIRAKGDLSVDTGGAKPDIDGRLDVEQLNLNPYMPGESDESDGGPGTSSDGKPGGGSSDWSDEPIDLTALQAANGDLSLTVAGLQMRDIMLGRSALNVSLHDGVLTADLRELQMYEGAGTARIVVHSTGDAPTIEHSLSVDGVQAEPLLTDGLDFERLEGTGKLTWRITSRGRTQRELVQNANGYGEVIFTNGAIKGVNLGAMVRNIQSGFLNPTARETQKTDFAELSGTFQITDGVLSNDDLHLLNPLLRLEGAGLVNLLQRTIDYRLVPKVVATLSGQGGEAQKQGIAVPVNVTGPWDDLRYRPDLKGILEETLKNPAGILGGTAGDGDTTGDPTEETSALDTVKEGGEKTLDTLKEEGEAALDALKELFGE